MAKPVITDKPIIDQAEFNGVTIWRKEGGSIEVSDTNYPSMKAALQDIAAKAGIKLEEGWNTQYTGWYLISKLKSAQITIDRITNNLNDCRFAIQKENIDSNKYDLETFIHNGKVLVKLTHENVAKVEAMIRNDSDYLAAGNKEYAPTDKYSGSTAYWASELCGIFSNNNESNWTEDVIVEGFIRAVDRDNSTHLNADGVGIEQTVEKVLSILHTRLYDLLRNPEKNNYELIRILSAPTKIKADDTKHKSRENYSFATKFSHYACFYLFEGEKEQDNFSIYDYVVASALPFYASYYGIPYNRDAMKNYTQYIRMVDSVIYASGAKISRNGFDHLLWYYFKGRLKSLK